MKQKITLLAAACVWAFSGMLMAQPSKEEQAAMEKAWNDFMTPGEMHKMMASSNGEWNEEITFWMDPSAPPTKNTAVCTNTMILGGRYQQSVHKGEFGGMPFEGVSTWGYNNSRKLFESSWIDNMGTGVMYMEGGWDEKTKSCTMKGKSTDPVTGRQYMAREVMRFIDDNTQIMEMYESKDGKERKTMEIKFTRK